MRLLSTLSIGAAALAASFVWAGPQNTGFNDAGIDWHDLSEGLAKAQQEDKQIFLLVHATWCPACKEYRQAFFHPQIEQMAEHFVFVLVDRDLEPKASARYAEDGEYIPRSMVLDSAGQLQSEFTSGRQDFRYFLDPSNHRQLLSVLSQASD